MGVVLLRSLRPACLVVIASAALAGEQSPKPKGKPQERDTQQRIASLYDRIAQIEISEKQISERRKAYIDLMTAIHASIRAKGSSGPAGLKDGTAQALDVAEKYLAWRSRQLQESLNRCPVEEALCLGVHWKAILKQTESKAVPDPAQGGPARK